MFKLTSQVHRGATTQLICQTNVTVLDDEMGEGKTGLDLRDGAELTTIDNFLYAVCCRMEPARNMLGTYRKEYICDLPIVEGLQKYQILLLGKRKHLACLFGRVCTWLLKENMLPSCEGLHSPLIVEAIGQL